MTPRRDIDRTITDWLETEAMAVDTSYLGETLAMLDATPQRRWRGRLTRALPRVPTFVLPPRAVQLAIVAFLALALAAAAVLIGSQPRLPAPFGLASNGRIAYDNGENVFVAESDGSRPIEIVGGERYDFSPSFSPDGTLVAFWSSRRTSREYGGSLFVAEADGSGEARPMGPGTILEGRPDMPPAWSPDSRSIAYPAWSAAENDYGIYVASVDTGKVRNVAQTENSSGFAAWSPDGQWIAYREAFGDRTRLSIVRPDGRDPRELRSAAGDVDAFTQLAWAPDSSALVYHRPPEEVSVKAAIYIFDLANGERQLSRRGRVAYTPTWSTDGTRIAYYEEIAESTGELHYELVISTVDGRDHQNLGRLGDCVALWSPDSRYLISYEKGCFTDQLVVITVADGSVRTIDLPGDMAGAPSWQRVANP